MRRYVVTAQTGTTRIENRGATIIGAWTETILSDKLSSDDVAELSRLYVKARATVQYGHSQLNFTAEEKNGKYSVTIRRYPHGPRY